jgi:hypothetical protein
VREVGRNGIGCSGPPQLAASPGGVPPWEAFPVVDRVLVQRLLDLLVERRMAPAAPAGGWDGGERDRRADEAAGGRGLGGPIQRTG